MSNLVANDYEWPSGQLGVQLVVHSHVIGYAALVDGGYLVQGKRKPVATISAAAKQCLYAQINAHHNEIEKLRKMLTALY